MNLKNIKKIVQDSPSWAYSYNPDTKKYYTKYESCLNDITIKDLKEKGIRLIDKKYNMLYWMFIIFNVFLIVVLYGVGAYK
jgi:hypothetical protein